MRVNNYRISVPRNHEDVRLHLRGSSDHTILMYESPDFTLPFVRVAVPQLHFRIHSREF